MAKAGITIIPLDSGLIGFGGDDAAAFLHAQLTSDVASLTTTLSQYSGYCTPKGRLLASFLVWQGETGFYLQLPALLREATQKQLSKYILRSKVKAADASAEFCCFGVAGDDAEAAVKDAFGIAPAAPHEVAHRDGITIIRLPVDRFELVIPRESGNASLGLLGVEAESGSREYWDLLDIRAGIPVITPETQEAFVPQMVNFDAIGAVSLSKGCYPGQEIVARMHYLGRLKQRMYLAHLAEDTAPRPGDKLYSAGLGEQASGTVVNAASSPDGGYDMLAVIQIQSAAGEAIHWRWPDGPVLRLLSLPYRV